MFGNTCFSYRCIPTYLNVYAYQKAIMGPDHEEHHGGNHHLDDHGHHHTTTETHEANNDGGQDSHDNHDSSGHDSSAHDSGGHDNGAHDSGGHGGDSCCNGKCVLDTLIGKDSTSFAVLIKDVTDVLKTTRLAKRRVSVQADDCFNTVFLFSGINRLEF